MHEAPARLPALTIPMVLIASVVVVSLLGLLVQPLRRALILNPCRAIQRGEVYRLLTAGWVHTDVIHLAFNMITLYFFADEALRVLGAVRFLALYISAVIVAFIPTTLRYMKIPNYNTLGASGAVTAVMFSTILLYPKMKLYAMFVPVPVSGPVYALIYLAYCVWSSYTKRDNVNHEAHFAGAIYGALFTYAFEPARVERTLRNLW